MAAAVPPPLPPSVIKGFFFEKSSVQFGEIIGRGGFSQIWSVNAKTPSGDTKAAAAKKVRGIEVKEVQVMKELNHPNVVTFYGILSDGPDTYIIMERATNGDLRHYLSAWREKEKRMLPLNLAQKWVYEAACGVDYLHSIQHTTHRDIKSLNYLIMEDMTLKLGDLGLAKEMDFTQETSGQRGTCRWMAPEVIKEQMRSIKSDVYSYGVVVWEIGTTQIPFEDMKGDFQVMNAVCNGKRPAIPDDCPQQLKKLIEVCWQNDYRERPAMGEICQMLKQSAETEASCEDLVNQLQATAFTEGLSIPIQAQSGDNDTPMDIHSHGRDESDNDKDRHDPEHHQEIFKLPPDPGVSDDIVMTSASPYSSQHMKSAGKMDSDMSTDDTGCVAMYRMCHVPRGICLIINNEDFSDARARGHTQLFDREGSSQDRDKLDAIFRKFKFDIQHEVNLATTPMYDVLDSIRRKSHSSFDAFVCCILTHGKLGAVAGCEGQYLQIQDILSLFTAEKCPSLRGKPKIFFIQACQGQASHLKHNICHDAPGDPTSSLTGIGAALDKTLPNHADFLLGFATVPGHVSYRNTVLGSWYVSILVDKLERLHDSEDLMSILTEVNRKLSKESAKIGAGEYGQIPAPVTTLRKKVYFTTWESTEFKK
ncbi:uncharacterized protein [Amphiura filiformis]|uniref:uncharacterized protein n=1 Tax=Amphiura filiformis TaxID=82378 RepID=UPI003B2194D6